MPEEVHTLIPGMLLLLAGVVAIVGSRACRVSSVVGFLVVGAAIGHGGLALVRETATTHLLAELGVVFLLFDIGLHFSMRRLWQVRRETLGMHARPMIVIPRVRMDAARSVSADVRRRFPDLIRVAGVDTDDERDEYEALGGVAVRLRAVPPGVDLAGEVLRRHGVDEARIAAWTQRQQRALRDAEAARAATASPAATPVAAEALAGASR